MSYHLFYPASSAIQSEDGAYDCDATSTFQSAAFHGSINNGYDVASSSPGQKAFKGIIEGVRRTHYEENLAYSPRMNQSQGAMVYDARMGTSHFGNNGGYDASTYGNMPAMGADFAGNQLAFANNLQFDTAVPAHAST